MNSWKPWVYSDSIRRVVCPLLLQLRSLAMWTWSHGLPKGRAVKGCQGLRLRSLGSTECIGRSKSFSGWKPSRSLGSHWHTHDTHGTRMGSVLLLCAICTCFLTLWLFEGECKDWVCWTQNKGFLIPSLKLTFDTIWRCISYQSMVIFHCHVSFSGVYFMVFFGPSLRKVSGVGRIEPENWWIGRWFSLGKGCILRFHVNLPGCNPNQENCKKHTVFI